MPAYRITINDRIYEGVYNSRPNAVYGAMLKDSHDCNGAIRARDEGPAHSTTCPKGANVYDRCDCGGVKRWHRWQQQQRAAFAAHTIHVQEIGRTTKKVHRVAP